MTRARRASVAELTVVDIGGRGDGIARHGDVPVFLPFTVPGDRVRATLAPRRDGGLDGTVTEILAAGPDRARPPCPHFTRCGGCSLQHLGDDAYMEWKLATLHAALSRQGLPQPAFEPLVRTAPGERRRARFTGIGRRGGMFLGFNESRGHVVVDVRRCDILTPRLVGLLPPLRALLSPAVAPGTRLDVDALDVAGALDIGVIAPFELDLALREGLASLADSQDIARIVWRRSDREAAEPIMLRRPVQAGFAGIAVDLPPGAFLQASLAGECALTEFVLRHAAGAVVELFAGAGTFTLPLATAGHRIAAFEGDAAMVAALTAAMRRSQVMGSIERRDLVRQPFAAAELAGVDTVLLDPPRAGAADQVGGIAAAAVSTVVYVSCNPVSFARDARRLCEAGFRLERVLPVDQFLWSPHLELAALLRR